MRLQARSSRRRAHGDHRSTDVAPFATRITRARSSTLSMAALSYNDFLTSNGVPAARRLARVALTRSPTRGEFSGEKVFGWYDERFAEWQSRLSQKNTASHFFLVLVVPTISTQKTSLVFWVEMVRTANTRKHIFWERSLPGERRKEIVASPSSSAPTGPIFSGWGVSSRERRQA